MIRTAAERNEGLFRNLIQYMKRSSASWHWRANRSIRDCSYSTCD
jgi:hypothetical protein